jgi:phosphoglycerol transferase MdoB-like AlkP superfamily enzyme
MKSMTILKIKKFIETNRMSFVLLFYLFCLAVNFIIRAILVIKEFSGLSAAFIDLPKIFLGGIYNDTLNFSYFLIPIVVYLIIVPEKIYKSQFQIYCNHLAAFCVIAIFTFQAHAEWFFWNEFSARFNFIAVDYLVYTKEVLGNIKESYPMHLVYASVIGSALFIYALFFKLVHAIPHREHDAKFFHRLKSGLIVLLIPLSSFVIFDRAFRKVSENNTVNELAGNGLWQLFHAFRHNELDYNSYFKTLDENQVSQFMEKELSTPHSTPSNVLGDSYIRKIRSPGKELHYNVVLVGVESLGANFMARFGGPPNVTPHLDALANNSLFFSNIYATGTRTVRGLEALTLSIPPTPGASIVRRNNNENLFSIGKVFRDRLYETKFIYGGYGAFDNMNAFFAGNGFEIVDRTNFEHGEYIMANIWGVDDESLFNKALKEADKSYRNRKKFFNFVMTTSNHRPFTYPEGRIDIPSHTSREGAVKYTDYAINKFLKDAQKKPWFHNTIFVIVADHGVGGRGTVEIQMDQFHIPFFIYAPGIIKPQIVDRLASQIDVDPTLLALLNFSYDSKFFGKNILEMTEDEERAILGTYSSLGFYSKGTFVTLGLNKSVVYNKYDPKTMTFSKANKGIEDLVVRDQAISYYQNASYLWKNGLYGEDTLINGQLKALDKKTTK